jgi:hypothetical protein
MSGLDDLWRSHRVQHTSPRRKKRPEAKIQAEIVRWLLGKGAVLAITDAGILSKMGLNARCGIPEGWPDLTCCLPGGRFLGVECKSSKGKQSRIQTVAQDKIEKNGGLYILAHSLAEFLSELSKENLLNPFNFPVD